jgi:hypothetical protein
MQELSKDACLSTHILKLPDQFSGAWWFDEKTNI